jgi:hypothetical protein
MTPELLKEWIKAKKAEDKAKQKRLDIEAQIEVPEFEGQSTTIKVGDLVDQFKVNFKKNESYSFDQEKWVIARRNIPADLLPEKIKYDVDKTGIEWLKENNPEVYKTVSDCVTFKIGKVSFKIEKL